jgi:penicillin-binding protein 1A
MADRGAGLLAGDVTGAGEGRRPVRERAARAVGAVLVLILIAAVLTTAVGWVITPPVNDLPDRVRNLLERHGGGGVLVLPQPDRAGEALVATEDHRFYSHHGLDPFGVARVAWAAAHGRDAGGATIDQQLAKMVYGQGDGGLLAEFDEAVLALKIDHEYPKDQILSAYLTVVYFGHGYYGLDQAAGGYFGVTPAELSWGQASLLAGLVLAPSAYDPLLHFDAARERQRHVLDRLVAVGDLTAPQADAAFASPLGLRSGT